MQLRAKLARGREEERDRNFPNATDFVVANCLCLGRCFGTAQQQAVSDYEIPECNWRIMREMGVNERR